MATREQSIAEVRRLLDNPYQQSPSLDKIVAGHLRFEQMMCNRLNNTGKPWTYKTFSFTSDPLLDTYDAVDGSDVPISDFGKPLYVVRATDEIGLPFVQVPFDDINDLNYGFAGVPTPVTPPIFGIESSGANITFFREGMINPVLKMKLNPVFKTPSVYTIAYSVGAIGRDDPLSVIYALPEHAALVEVGNALSQLPYAKWREDDAFNTNKRKEIGQSLGMQMQLLTPIFEKYIRQMTHSRPVEVETWDGY